MCMPLNKWFCFFKFQVVLLLGGFFRAKIVLRRAPGAGSVLANNAIHGTRLEQKQENGYQKQHRKELKMLSMHLNDWMNTKEEQLYPIFRMVV